MIIDGKTISAQKDFDGDVCIVGGGPAGLVLAKELDSSGFSVVLLESGSVTYDQQTQAHYQSNKHPELFPNPHFSRLRFLGGSSNHWENNTSTFTALDFEERDWIANSGWPISYSDIEPYYAKAGEYCGTGNDGYAVSYWKRELNKKDLLESSTVLETGIAKASLPPVRFFNSYGKDLVESENVTIVTFANLFDIEYDKLGKKLSRVFFKSIGGISHSVSATHFVLAMGGIENARMLLKFNAKNENQLGNQGDSVGRYFMEHPTVRASHLFTNKIDSFDFYNRTLVDEKLVIGFMQLTQSEQVRSETANLRMPLISATNYTLSDGISSFHTISDSIGKKEFPDDFGTHLFNVISDVDMVIEAISRNSFDSKIFEHAGHVAGFQMPMMTEQAPYRDNRITLSNNLDSIGIPKVNIDWTLKSQDKELVWKTLEIVAKEIGALDIGRLRLLREQDERIWNSQLGFAHHHMGTTRMAHEPDKGVVNSDLQVFGCNNLFIAGSSSFSTGSHVPPTLTIVAFAIRLADKIKSLLGGRHAY